MRYTRLGQTRLKAPEARSRSKAPHPPEINLSAQDRQEADEIVAGAVPVGGPSPESV